MIGVFDSGLGGLSVFREIFKILPESSYTYVSDAGYCPYGPRPAEEVIMRADRISSYLVAHGAKIIVVACNTATAASIRYLREKFDIPFVGMEPAVKPAVLKTKNGVIGVLATQGTLKGELYHTTLVRYASDVKVIERAGTGLVDLVESGETSGPVTESLIRKYVDPMVAGGADKIVLGCTHYPFLADTIRSVYGDSVELIDPAPAVARRCAELISEFNLCTNGNFAYFYTTGKDVGMLRSMAEKHVAGLDRKDKLFGNLTI